MGIELHLRIVGTALVLLALAHVPFYWTFGWRDELPRLSRFNHQVFLVHAFFLAGSVGALGLLSATAPGVLLEPGRLQTLFLGFVTTFWSIRLMFQLFVYDRQIWRGNRFRTLGHIGFSLFWVYIIFTYASALRLQLGA